MEVGLLVDGLVIAHPTTWVTYCPDLTPRPELGVQTPGPYLVSTHGYRPDAYLSREAKQYLRYHHLLRAYTTASEKVGAWDGELDQWLAQYMAPLVAQIDDLSPIAEILARLRDGEEGLISAALAGVESRMQLQLADWRAAQNEISEQAAEIRRWRRSENPARQAAYARFNSDLSNFRISQLEIRIGTIAGVSRVVPVVGTLIDIGFTAAAIAEGASETSAIAGLVGGVAGGAAGGAIVGGAAVALGSNPVGWVVAGPAALGIGGAAAGSWLWEATVPLDARESMDHWFNETFWWDSTNASLVPGQ
ncbi:MAG: hypothetical protein ACK5H2_10500 [Beutenbergiaceae bacterium]